jgi:DNA-directed RNA polymerase subunit RPC12/RpoP
MIPNRILGIPIIEAAAPSDFVAEQDRELYAQIRAAIDMLRCPTCGSLNYQTTLFVFSTGIEKMIECRNCNSVHAEMLDVHAMGHLDFLTRSIIQEGVPEE